jgi:leucyl aminopeptidase
MFDRPLDCVAEPGGDALPLYAVRPDGLAAWFETQPVSIAAYLRAVGFQAKAGEIQMLPAEAGLAGAVLGLGDDTSPFAFGSAPTRLPAGTTWRLVDGDYDPAAAVLGFCLGAYRYTAFRPSNTDLARLVVDGHAESLSAATAAWLTRDLINTPANALGPVELAAAAEALGARFGAAVDVAAGEALTREYPMLAAVGAGSERPARVVTLRWRGSTARDDSPLISLCGKGVCFDTGGYDLKPSSAMLRMKKDMGGAATVLGLTRMIMAADLPVRLETRLGCVENAVSGHAMRPLDVIRTRKGLTVEIGNTDAEGRLVLCDIMAEACEASPTLLIDCATLTGAARVAVGPDLPALFCNDDAIAESLSRLGQAVSDPVWRLPLWAGYDDWLKSPIADLNNVSTRPMAGAVVAALYLRRFVTPGIPWIHLDLYAWNDQTRPGRPEGGEMMAARSLFAMIKERYSNIPQPA